MFNERPHAPLAEQMRPADWRDVVGQAHVLGEGKPLRLAFESGQAQSMILWGPPGVGKTTLARLSAQAFRCEWIALSAVFSGVKDIREAVETAQSHLAEGRGRTVLFIDEIHRFNKAQQDALLPYTESGLLTFIGATTENPSFEINKALLSRAPVYVLNPLDKDALTLLFERALARHLSHITFDESAKTVLIEQADGDARRLLNELERVEHALKALGENHVTLECFEAMASRKYRRFDKGGDTFYDEISALHKSVRGSHPDAALYWFSRMMDGGACINYLSRRIVRMAWEDIGLADPRAMQIANDAAQTVDRLGSPEGELALAQAIIYLAVAAKSNAGYKAFNHAKAYVKDAPSHPVPHHLRNAPTDLMKQLGYGKAYRYAHDEPNAYAAGEHYLPEGMDAPNWYQPVNRGLEQKIAKKIDFLRTLDKRARGEE